MNRLDAQFKRNGFTLTEVMVAMTVGIMILGSIMAVFLNYLKNSDRIQDHQIAGFEATTGLERILKGGPNTLGLRSFTNDDTTCVTTASGWKIENVGKGDSFTYSKADETIVDAAGNVMVEQVSNSEILGRDGDLISLMVEVDVDGASSRYQTTILMRN